MSTNGGTLDQALDVLVVGGGITGAGVAREAAGSGLNTLLVEQRDFAWGTSSRSSKMVHGGLRYLGSGQWRLAREAVRERQRLLTEAPGLVDPLPFVMAHRAGEFPGPGLFQGLLRLYDRLGHTRTRRRLTPAECRAFWVPGLADEALAGASVFSDAVTDDARLVLRVLDEARQDGARTRNYTRALSVAAPGADGRRRVVLEDVDTGDRTEVAARLVIKATGAWGGLPHDSENPPQGNPGLTIRPLRGSHLVLPWHRLPVTCAVTLLHPDDRRPVFAFPWHGTTVLGTTDLDHRDSLEHEPRITPEEVHYLVAIADRLFPGPPVAPGDILSTWAGVRPVVTRTSAHGDQQKAPSRENREHVLQVSPGQVTIAGGKLTTFRCIARAALRKGFGSLSESTQSLRPEALPVFRPASAELRRPEGLGHRQWQRLQGYYGARLADLLDTAPMTPVPGTDVLWAELVWACQQEQVRHLDDLMLRRSRLGLILPRGGEACLDDLRRHCQPALGWTDAQWQRETERYRTIYQQAYQVPANEAPHPRTDDSGATG
ncbi:glycerol-3-phosphate dehydrogenase/oxidase [Marinobacter sp. C2H3]|uniref:glycerol-3-phosphate dehydrogenase/oxidase n=1 Tax=Marinobacter sp. C2H3 TaxID=3119003 RepID=UPI00300F1497